MMRICEQNPLIFEGAQSSECPVQSALYIVTLAGQNVCGRGTICRDGLVQLRHIIGDITQGKGKDNDLELLEDLLSVMAMAADCEMVKHAVAEVTASLHDNSEEWKAHLFRKRCANRVCAALIIKLPEMAEGTRRRRRR